MLEITTTRDNPMVDPSLHVWGWEIPVYLFVGGVVAGMMILAGIAMMCIAKGEDPKGFFSIQTPLLGFMLLNIGMLALFLDLEHRLYVWAVYLTFEPMSPMSWGSWVLLVVYGVLLVSALIRLPDAWPWLGRRVPQLQRLSDYIVARPGLMKALGWTNVVLGVILGIYTRILLNTMVARPLWNTTLAAVPCFRAFRCCGDGASRHAHLPGSPRATGHDRRRVRVDQPSAAQPLERTISSIIRADLRFLAVRLLTRLLIIGLLTAAPYTRRRRG
jgi:hypothetical protein